VQAITPEKNGGTEKRKGACACHPTLTWFANALQIRPLS
jgi:hypothetical protein